jgi:DNA-binding CsgD family transcriptional regulator
MYFQYYVAGDATHLGDVQTAGPAASALDAMRKADAASSTGHAATRLRHAPWRKGQWDAHLPLPRHTNRFSVGRDDSDWAQMLESEIGRNFYKPARIDDQLRSFMYDGQTFVGWIGAFRQGGRPFSAKDRRVVNARTGEIRDLLLAAHGSCVPLADNRAIHAVFRLDGSLEHTSAAEFYDNERLDHVCRAIRADVGEREGPMPASFHCGVEYELTKLDGATGVRYLVIARHARLLVASPLRVLTAAERLIAKEAAEGKQVDEIGVAFELSPNTVKHHLKRDPSAKGF